MSFEPTSLIHVSFMPEKEKIPMGRLALKDRQLFFEYNLSFIQRGLELSPFKLPLKPGVFTCDDPLFGGLWGVFNDSLPDGWGRLLLDRKLMKMQVNPGDLSPLDRLRYVGHRGMGALIYEPEIEGPVPSDHEDLDTLADEATHFQNNDDDRFIDTLLDLNGSSAGARPKMLTRIEDEDWIIKFRSFIDPKDIGPIEYAYHLMALDAKLEVPQAKLFPSKVCPGYFGVKRFDRVKGKRLHMHTISGLLHADHRFPSLDYEAIMKATLWLSKDSRACEKQFRAAVFNVLSHNRDDHAKNFSFLMDEKGTWQVSPAYDLTFSSGPSGEHCSTIMGEGKHPSITHLLKLAAVTSLKKQTALQIIEEVKAATSKWKLFATEAGVHANSLKMIQSALHRIERENRGSL